MGPRHRDEFLVSTGNDEAAQRADAVAIKAEKPFAIVNFVPAGLDFLDSEMAKAKILVFGYATTARRRSRRRRIAGA